MEDIFLSIPLPDAKKVSGALGIRPWTCQYTEGYSNMKLSSAEMKDGDITEGEH